MGVTPAYVALIAEASIDAAVRNGLKADLATDIFLAALAGSAALLQARDGDTLAVRREVTSPGGSTARGLAALERHGLRTAFDEATRAVLNR
jgi:pyrroline-5-carboxylate reductase